jgi:hypothetical protein
LVCNSQLPWLIGFSVLPKAESPVTWWYLWDENPDSASGYFNIWQGWYWNQSQWIYFSGKVPMKQTYVAVPPVDLELSGFVGGSHPGLANDLYATGWNGAYAAWQHFVVTTGQ